MASQALAITSTSTSRGSGEQALAAALKALKDCLSPTDQAALSRRTSQSPSSVTEFIRQLNETKSNKIKEASRRIEPFLRSIQRFSGAVDVMVQGSAIASLMWGSIKIVLVLAFNLLDYADKISKMFSRLGSLCPVYERFEKLFPKSVELREAIFDFYITVVDFCKKVTVFSREAKTKFLTKSIWKDLKSSFEEIERDLGDQKDIIDLEITYASERFHAMSMQQMVIYQDRSLKNQLWEIEQLRQSRDWQLQKDAEAAKIRWELLLAKVCDYNHVSAFLNIKDRRNQDTGKWLFTTREYLDWTAGKQSSGLWCHGIPGSGKSFLMSGLIEHLVPSITPDTIVCYFFATFSDQTSLLARTIFTSLAKQILILLGHTLLGLEDFVRETFDQPYPPQTETCRIFLMNLLRRSKRTVYLLLDGVDECNDCERHKIISFVNQIISAQNLSVKCYIASRSEPQISKQLSELQELCLGADRNSQDIEAFIKSEIQERKNRGELAGVSESLLTLIKSTLASKAGAMFLLVFYQLQEVFLVNDEKAICNALNHIPTSLNGLFNRIANRIIAERDAETAKRIFKWIIYAKRPLTTVELAEAISISPGAKSWSSISFPLDHTRMLMNCGPLILENPTSNTVTLAHNTVEEFLISSTCSPFYQDFVGGDLDLGKVCITYINFLEFNTAVTLPTAEDKTQQLPHENIQLSYSANGFVPLLFNSQSKVGRIWTYMSRIANAKTDEQSKPGNFQANLSFRMPELKITSYCRDVFSSYNDTFHLLKYAAQDWIFHCSAMAREDELWEIFSNTLQGLKCPFPYLPWQNEPPRKPRIPDYPPNILPFFWAASNGCLALVRLILDDPYNNPKVFEYGCTPQYSPYLEYQLDGKYAIEYAIMKGDTPVVKLLNKEYRALNPPGIFSGGTNSINTEEEPGPSIRRFVALAMKSGYVSIARCLLQEPFVDTGGKDLTSDIFIKLSGNERIHLIGLAARLNLNDIFLELFKIEEGYSHFNDQVVGKWQINSVLAAAAKGGNVEAVEMLLGCLRKNVKTPLMLDKKAEYVVPEFVPSFFQDEDWFGLSPLEAACTVHSRAAMALLPLLGDQRYYHNYAEALYSAIGKAARNGDPNIVNALVDSLEKTPAEVKQAITKSPAENCYSREVIRPDFLINAATGGDISIFRLLNQKSLYTSIYSHVGFHAMDDGIFKDGTPVREYTKTLEAAAAHGHFSLIQEIFELLRARDENDLTGFTEIEFYQRLFQPALVKALEGGHDEIVFWILRNAPGADFLTKGEADHALSPLEIRTPMQAAIATGSLRMVRYLQKYAYHGSRGLRSLVANETFLCLAAKNKHLAMVEWLLSEGCNPNEWTGTTFGFDIPYPIKLAAQVGHVQILRCLLVAGADPMIGYDPNGDNQGRNAFIEAAEAGHAQALSILLASMSTGLAIERLGIDMESIASQGHFEVIKILLDYPLFKSPQNSGPALIAAATGGYCEIAQIIIDRGQPEGKELSTAISTAKENGYVEFVKLFNKVLLPQDVREQLRNIASMARRGDRFWGLVIDGKYSLGKSAEGFSSQF